VRDELRLHRSPAFSLDGRRQAAASPLTRGILTLGCGRRTLYYEVLGNAAFPMRPIQRSQLAGPLSGLSQAGPTVGLLFHASENGTCAFRPANGDSGSGD
jgi:hypothetical protein